MLPEPEGDVQRETLGSLQKGFSGIGMLVYKSQSESGGIVRDGWPVSADVRDVDEVVVGVLKDHVEHLDRK